MKKLNEIRNCIIKVLTNKGGYDDLILELEKTTTIEEIDTIILKVKDSEIYRKILLCYNNYQPE